MKTLFEPLKMKHSSLGLGKRALADTARVQGDSFAKSEKDLERYGRFDPALDADGNPISASWATRITYKLN